MFKVKAREVAGSGGVGGGDGGCSGGGDGGVEGGCVT